MIRQLQPTEQVYQLDRLFNQLNSVERDKLISLIEQIIEWKNSGKTTALLVTEVMHHFHALKR